MGKFIKILNIIMLALYIIIGITYYFVNYYLLNLLVGFLLIQIITLSLSLFVLRGKVYKISKINTKMTVIIAAAFIFVILINIQIDVNIKEKLFFLLDFPILIMLIEVYQILKKEDNQGTSNL